MMNLYHFSFRRIFLALWAIAIPSLLQAQEEKELAPVSRTYAITNVTIVQAPGRKVEMGVVVIKNGLIQAVGKGVPIPPEAIIIKADSMYVYAGFIDGLSHAGITKPKEDQNRERPKDPGNPTPDRAGISPQNSVRDLLNPADKSIEELRALGFTAAHVVPYGGMLPGKGSLILLNGSSADAMILQNNMTFYSALTPAERVYPATVMGVMAKYRELYRQALISKSYESTYASNRAGLERPSSNRITESFYPVIDKQLPVFFKAEKVLEIQQVLTLQKDLGFNLMLGELKEGWDVINKLKASKAKLFLSLDLPEEKKKEEKPAVKKEGEKKEEKKEGEKKEEKKEGEEKEEKKEEEKKEEKKEEKPKSPADLEKEVLEKRKADFIAKYNAQASTFQKAGFKFGFSTMSAKTKDIHGNLRKMIAAGLSEDEALAALTTSPAELLGLSDRLGTVDNGKIANLVISDKPYFNEKAKVRYVFVDGQMFKFDAKEVKKTDASIDISGSWSVTTDSPQGKSANSISFKKEGSSYTGKISGSSLPQPIDLENIELNGNELKFSYNVTVGGNVLRVDVLGTVEGDTFKGSASVGQFGSFPMEGKKDPKF